MFDNVPMADQLSDVDKSKLDQASILNEQAFRMMFTQDIGMDIHPLVYHRYSSTFRAGASSPIAPQ